MGRYLCGRAYGECSICEIKNKGNYLSGIMATDFEITEVTKCIDDIIINYEKEKLITRRNDIIKKLEDTDKLTQDEIASLEKELSDSIIKLARMK